MTPQIKLSGIVCNTIVDMINDSTNKIIRYCLQYHSRYFFKKNLRKIKVKGPCANFAEQDRWVKVSWANGAGGVRNLGERTAIQYTQCDPLNFGQVNLNDLHLNYHVNRLISNLSKNKYELQAQFKM